MSTVGKRPATRSGHSIIAHRVRAEEFGEAGRIPFGRIAESIKIKVIKV